MDLLVDEFWQQHDRHLSVMEMLIRVEPQALGSHILLPVLMSL
jgi:hypothetical protein